MRQNILRLCFHLFSLPNTCSCARRVHYIFRRVPLLVFFHDALNMNNGQACPYRKRWSLRRYKQHQYVDTDLIRISIDFCQTQNSYSNLHDSLSETKTLSVLIVRPFLSHCTNDHSKSVCANKLRSICFFLCFLELSGQINSICHWNSTINSRYIEDITRKIKRFRLRWHFHISRM